jgi:hypothetical protein
MELDNVFKELETDFAGNLQGKDLPEGGFCLKAGGCPHAKRCPQEEPPKPREMRGEIITFCQYSCSGLVIRITL